MVNAKEGVTCVKKHLEAIEKQERENAAAAKEIDKGVAEIVSGIRAQERKNDKFIDLFYYGCVKKE